MVIALAAGLVAFSPIALRAWAPRLGDWERLSWIGQTYGAASALLAVLALIGISVSLVLQARETKATREQAVRAVHTDLLRMAMEDEVYRRAWGPYFAAGDSERQRQHMYINLIVSNWQMRWGLRDLSEQHLRATAHVLLSGEPGQRFWAEGRELRLRAVNGRRERRFHQILDEEYQHARRDPARPHAPLPAEKTKARRPWLLIGGTLAAATVLVPVLRRLVGHRNDR
ncbi:DUF6082 family protein [Spirillospora sp. NPDC049652]